MSPICAAGQRFGHIINRFLSRIPAAFHKRRAFTQLLDAQKVFTA